MTKSIKKDYIVVGLGYDGNEGVLIMQNPNENQLPSYGVGVTAQRLYSKKPKNSDIQKAVEEFFSGGNL
ncbi:MAG: hypothetical protein ABFQ65_00725 [Nanoarchaeota archaeon]